MVSGELFVTTTGVTLMLRWSVGSLDCLSVELRLSPMPTLDKGRDQLFSIMFTVLGMRHISRTAKIMDCLFTTVSTMKMLESGAKVSVYVYERERERERGGGGEWGDMGERLGSIYMY